MLERVRTMRSALDKKLATRFSIFEPTGCNENTLSAIIGMLLDPNGTHGQGEGFLRAFLKMFSDNKRVEDFIKLDLKKAKVKCEDSTPDNRRIDVTVSIGNTKFGIENKIWAGDQKKQVSDYLKGENLDFLIYLNPYGNNPSEYSIPEDEFKEKKSEGELLIMSYKYSSASIYIWLKECAQITESDKIRWYIQEVMNYIDIKICEEEPFMSDFVLKDILLKDKDVTDAYIELRRYENDLKKSLVGNFLKKLRDNLEKKLKNVDLQNWEAVYDNVRSICIKRDENDKEHFLIDFDRDNYEHMYFQWCSQNYHEKFKIFFEVKHPSNDGGIWEYVDQLKRLDIKQLNELNHDESNNSDFAILINELSDKTVNFLKAIDKASLEHTT